MKKLAAIIAAAAVLLCGCARDSQQIKHISNRELRVCSLHELTNIDPQAVSDDSDYKIIQSVFEGLVVVDPDTGHPVPGVAEHWTISDDGKVYTFYIREDARWSNGMPVTADDFVYSAKRALSPESACSDVDLFFPLNNAKAFHDGSIDDFSMVGIMSLSPKVLQITLEKPAPWFLSVLAHPCWSPLNDTVIASISDFNKRLSLNGAFQKSLVTNGPFMVENLQNCPIYLKKSDKYWDAKNVGLNSITFLGEHRQFEVEKHFSEKFIDIAEIYHDATDVINCFSSENDQIISPTQELFALTFNMRNEKFKKKQLRIVLSSAIDKEKILLAVKKSKLLRADGVLTIKNDTAAKQNGKHCTLDLAKKMLTGAGSFCRENLPSIRILCCAPLTEMECSILQNVKSDWDSIGVSVDIDACDFSQYIFKRKHADFDVVLTKYFSRYYDETAILESFTSQSDKNYGSWEDSVYDDLVKSLHECHGDDSRQYAMSANDRVINEAPVIPLFFESKSYLVNGITGFGSHTNNFHFFKFVRFVDDLKKWDLAEIFHFL